MQMNSVKKFLKDILPPFIVRLARWLSRKRPGYQFEWEVLDEWPQVATPGWSDPSIPERYAEKWAAFSLGLSGTGPLGLSPEANPAIRDDVIFHNINMTYGYVIGRAALGKTRISILDWGGGPGHYALIARALHPGMEIETHIKELPGTVELGNRLMPDAHFHSDEKCLVRTYDLVFASSSLHYDKNWRETLAHLRPAVGGYLFLTRLPIVLAVPSFPFIQRPYAFGYRSEYPAWCLNRQELLDVTDNLGLVLVREFITGEAPHIHKSPEDPAYRGFLFTPHKS